MSPFLCIRRINPAGLEKKRDVEETTTGRIRLEISCLESSVPGYEIASARDHAPTEKRVTPGEASHARIRRG